MLDAHEISGGDIGSGLQSAEEWVRSTAGLEEAIPGGYSATDLPGVAMPAELWQGLGRPEHASAAMAGAAQLETVRTEGGAK